MSRWSDWARGARIMVGGTLAALGVTVILGLSQGASVPPVRAAAPTSSLYYQSEAGSPVGRGWTFFTTSAESTFEGTQVRAADRTVSIGVGSPDDLRLVAGRTYDQGSVTIWDRYPVAGICVPSRKAFTVLDVGYDEPGQMTRLALSIRWSCLDGNGDPTATFFAELRLNTSDPAYGGVVVSPDGTLQAGRAAVDAARDTTVRLTAAGTRPTAIGQIHVTGDAAADYSIVADGCSDRSLNVGATCTFDVRLRPSVLGDRDGRLIVPLDTTPGELTVPVQGYGQIATTMTLTVPPGPFLGTVPLTLRLTPFPDDSAGSFCADLTLRSASEDQHVTYGCGGGPFTGTIDLRLAPGEWTATAEFAGTDRYAGSKTPTVHILRVDEWKAWAAAWIDLATFYPYPDGYLDRLPIRLHRTRPVAAAVAVRAAGSGTIVATTSIPSGTGDGTIGWDGRRDEGGLLPAGQYDVAVTLSDDVGNARTLTWRIRISREWAQWTVRSVTLAGERFAFSGRSKDATVSSARSAYANGVRLTSGRGAVAVVYEFPVAASTVYGPMTLDVRGRSPNGHQATMAAWNPRLGTYLDLTSYDGSRVIGPAERTWSITVAGMDHIKGKSARLTVLTWAGLGRSGSAVFDIAQVRLRYRIGVLRPAATAPVIGTIGAGTFTTGPRLRVRPLDLTQHSVAAPDATPADPTPEPTADPSPAPG